MTRVIFITCQLFFVDFRPIRIPFSIWVLPEIYSFIAAATTKTILGVS